MSMFYMKFKISESLFKEDSQFGSQTKKTLPRLNLMKPNTKKKSCFWHSRPSLHPDGLSVA